MSNYDTSSDVASFDGLLDFLNIALKTLFS